MFSVYLGLNTAAASSKRREWKEGDDGEGELKKNRRKKKKTQHFSKVWTDCKVRSDPGS